MATGVAGALGLNAETGGDAQREQLQDDADSVPTGGGALSTLVGMYNVVTGFVANLLGFLTPGLTMLNNAGVPGPITGLLRNLFTVLIGIDIASFIAGRRL